MHDKTMRDPNSQHGGWSVMAWECFAGNKVGDLVQIEDIMDIKKYHNILQKHAFLCGK